MDRESRTKWMTFLALVAALLGAMVLGLSGDQLPKELAFVATLPFGWLLHGAMRLIHFIV